MIKFLEHTEKEKIRTHLAAIIYISFIVIGTSISLDHSVFWSGIPALSFVIDKAALLARVNLGVLAGIWFLVQHKKLKDWIWLGCFSAIGVYVLLYSQFYGFYDGLMVAFFLADCLEYKKMLRVFLGTTAGNVLWITVLSFFYNPRADEFVKNSGARRMNFGFSHPNIFGFFIMMLVMLYVLNRFQKLRWYDCGMVLAMAVAVLMTAESKTAGTLLILFACFMAVGMLLQKKGFFAKHPIHRCGWAKILAVLCVPAVVGFVYFVAMNGMENRWFGGLSSTLAARFTFGRACVKQFGFSLMGQPADTSYYIDSIYFYGPVVMGVIPTLIFLGALCVSIKKSFEKDHFILIGILLVFLVYGIMERYVLHFMASFVYIAAFCILPRQTVLGGEDELTQNRKYRQEKEE